MKIANRFYLLAIIVVVALAFPLAGCPSNSEDDDDDDDVVGDDDDDTSDDDDDNDDDNDTSDDDDDTADDDDDTTLVNECTDGTHECDENADCIDKVDGYTCRCHGGYEGDGFTCENVNECEGEEEVCHPDADCTDTEGGFECNCKDGYEGDGIESCVNIDECAAETSPCDANATCSDTPGSFECGCNDGYEGDGETCANIDECDLGTATCHPRASCVDTDGSYDCVCNDGYDGDGITACRDIDECATETDACVENAECENTVGSYDCNCNEGYTGDGLTECANIDECDVETDLCLEIATCEDNDGGYDCICPQGYEGDGITECINIDECTAETDECDDNATCTDTEGWYTCACKDGYTGDGLTCENIDECENETDNCHENALCLDLDGTFECNCKDGYAGDGVEACDNIDECAAETYPCDANAACEDFDGTFECSCNEGWTGDGFTCENVNECEAETYPCHDQADCADLDGTYECICKDGYAGDGVEHCDNIDECIEEPYPCDANAACEDFDGTFECACNEGWTGDGFQCENINECAATEYPCDENADCTDNDGSFECDCNWGYFGNGFTCANINECLLGIDNCHANADCIDNEGSFDCQCKEGFTGDGTTYCDDIDECAQGDNPCGNTECQNRPGTYSCACPEGFFTENNECKLLYAAYGHNPVVYTFDTMGNVLFDLYFEGEYQDEYYEVYGFTGMATNPVTGQLWVTVNGYHDSLSQYQRALGFLDIENETVHIVGGVGKFAGLAFDDQGTLYGLTGEGVNTLQATSLYTIDTETAEVEFLHNFNTRFDDGEAIAFNPVDGLLYHLSGFFNMYVGAYPVTFQSYDIATGSVEDVPFNETADINFDTYSMVWSYYYNGFLAADTWEPDGLLTIDPITGNLGEFGTEIETYAIKGLAFADGFDHCQNPIIECPAEAECISLVHENTCKCPEGSYYDEIGNQCLPWRMPDTGDIAVTEIQRNPSVGVWGQWLEIKNVSNDVLNLNGTQIGVSPVQPIIINTDIVFGPGEYVIIGADANPALNGGVEVDFASTLLDMTGVSEIGFWSFSGTALLNVPLSRIYGDGEPTNAAKQLHVFAETAEHSQSGLSWCTAILDYNGTDLGTPGMHNSSCFDIDWCRLQWPESYEGYGPETLEAYARLYINGLTDYSMNTDAADYILAEFGYGADASDPTIDPQSWTWMTAWGNPNWQDINEPNNDEYMVSFESPNVIGEYDYAFRFSADMGQTWTYCDTNTGAHGEDGSENGYQVENAGSYSLVGCESDDICDDIMLQCIQNLCVAGCQPDYHEDNNSPEQAMYIEGYYEFGDLTLCSGDEDWYYGDVGNNYYVIYINVELYDEDQKARIYLYGPDDSTLLAESATTTDQYGNTFATIEYFIPEGEGGRYYFKITGDTEDTVSAYYMETYVGED